MFVALGVIGFSLQLNAQTRTNYFKFIVNGSADSIMSQSDTMAWECNCGIGDTLTGELWLDLNANHIIDGNDKLWIMCPFKLIDGMTDWNQGPADSSAIPEGIFYCGMGDAISGMAFAPLNYVFRVINWVDSSTAENWLLVTPAISPPVTVSGTISIEGITAPDPLLNALWVGTNMETEPWWSAITDSYGVYTLNLPDTGTWHIGVEDNIPPYVKPESIELNITDSDTTGIDLEYISPEAYVYGDIKDDRDSLILIEMHISIKDEDTDEHIAQTSTNSGHYFMGVLAGDNYRLGIWEEELYPNYLTPMFWNDVFDVIISDSIRKDIILTRTDTTIFGLITEDGGLPSQAYRMEAEKDSVGHIYLNSDSATGLFEISVSSIVDSYWVTLNEWDTPLPSGFGFEEGNGWTVSIGDTVYVKLVSYKGSVSGSLSVAPGDPIVSDYTEFGVRVVNPTTWEAVAQSNVDSNGTYTVSVSEGTWNVELDCPENWMSFPHSIDSVTVDTVDVPGNDFLLNYGHCTLSGVLHGLFYVPENIYITAHGDSSWPHGYSKQCRVNQSDSSYSTKICDAEWTVNANWIEGYNLVSSDTTFTIGDSDSSATVDFYYVANRYLEWTGATGFESDGVNPDTGVYGDTFEFQVKYTDVHNDSPYVYEVWIDLDDDSDYDSSERFAMTEVNTNDTIYTDGKDYTFSVPIDSAGDGTINYCFYFSDQGGGKACGFPNLNNSFVVIEAGIAELKVPSITMLYPAAPNPSLGIVNIKYSLSKSANVSLRIYDITGRVVKTLVATKKKTGIHTLKWNGKNDAGTKLANGIYFYGFKSDEYHKTGKIIFLR